MKLKTKELKDALRECAKVIRPKQLVPQLSHVQFTTSGNELCLQASDGNAWVDRLLTFEGEGSQGCIPFRPLNSILEFTTSEDIDINISGATATIKTNATLTIPALAWDVFPDAPMDDRRALGISTPDLAEGLDATRWAAEGGSDDTSRLINLFVMSESKILKVYSGSKYSIARFSRPLISEPILFGVPANFAGLLSAVLREPESKISLAKNFVLAESKNGTATVKLVQDRPAPYDDAIGEPSTDAVELDRTIVRNACAHAEALTTDDKYPAIEIWWEMGRLHFRSVVDSSRDYEFETDGPSGDGWLKCNARHLQDALRNLPEGPLKVSTKPNGSFWMVNDVLVAIPQLGMRK